MDYGLSKIWMRMTNKSNSRTGKVETRAVFIVGMNGSGTTMMLDHLDHHPNLFGFGMETYILPHYLINESR